MNRDGRLNPANLLTLFRLLIVPAVLILLYAPGGSPISRSRSLAAFFLYVAASLTDLADGYVARRYGMVTPLGKLLDPLADKILVCGALVMLIPSGRVAAWMAAIVVAREIGVTALRGAASVEGMVIAASSLGKAKTTLLNIGVAALILHYPFWGLGETFGPEFVRWVGTGFLAAGIVFTAWSGLDYFFRFLGEVFKR